jgi:biotin carboxyl carrier protein
VEACDAAGRDRLLKYSIELDGARHQLDIEREQQASHVDIVFDGQAFRAHIQRLPDGQMSVLLNGRSFRVLCDAPGTDSVIFINGRAVQCRLDDPRSISFRRRHAIAGDGPRPVVAPMPGRVVRLLVGLGDQVEAKQGVLVIEAMKMQNELKSQKSGRVTRIAIQPGASVQAGEVLIVIE